MNVDHHWQCYQEGLFQISFLGMESGGIHEACYNSKILLLLHDQSNKIMVMPNHNKLTEQ